MKFEPNISGVSRFGVSINDFNLGFGISGSAQEIDLRKGTTSFLDLQLGYQKKNWGVDVFYQTYKGFYSESTQNIQLYPDLKFQHYGLMLRYALNESEFSVNGLVDQSDQVTTTAGKYYIVSGFREHAMENPTSLLQQDYAGGNPELEDLRKLNVTSFNLGVGTGKYWVSDSKFFVGGLADALVTFGLYHLESQHGVVSETNRSSYATLSYNLKLGLGFSGDSFKTGLSLANDVTTLKTPGASYLRPSAVRLLLYIRLVF